jgi:hypothetical protein
VTSTAEHQIPNDNHLVYAGDEVEDFQLRFQGRVMPPKENRNYIVGWVSFRSLVNDWDKPLVNWIYEMRLGGDYASTASFHIPGDKPVYLGSKIRLEGAANPRGFVVEEVEHISQIARGQSPHAADAWNVYSITVIGGHISIEVNGILSMDVIDERPTRRKSGVICLTMLNNARGTIQFKDLQLRKLAGAGSLPPATTSSSIPLRSLSTSAPM